MAKQEIPPSPTKKIPIFVGKSALVRLTNESDPSISTIWMIDSTNKTIRPFVSEDKFDSLFKDPAVAHRAVTTLSANELAPGGLLGDFNVLSSEYGVKNDGSMKPVDFSPSQLQGRYGKPVDENAENNAVNSLDSLFGGMSGQTPPQGQQTTPQGATPPPAAPQTPTGATGGPGSHTVRDDTEPGMIFDGKGGPNDLPTSMPMYNNGDNPNMDTAKRDKLNAEQDQWTTHSGGKSSIDATFVNKLMNNPTQMAAYIGAMAYGGYSIADVYVDMARQYQISIGNKNVPTSPLISYTNPRSQNPQIDQQEQGIVPTTDGFYGNDTNLSQYNAIQTPDYTPGKSYLVPGTDEYGAAFEKIMTNVFDALSLQASASTDSEHAYATANYQQQQQDAEDILGITLNNDATTAWSQLQAMDSMYGRKAYGRRGISGSGMEYGESEDVLNNLRQKDKATSLQALNAYDAKQATFLHTSGSPAQIAALTDAQRQAYGFIPSDPSKYTVAGIMSANPGMTLADATRYSNEIVDPATGYFRSTIYTKMYQDKGNTARKTATDAISASNDSYLANLKTGLTGDQSVPPADVTPTPSANGLTPNNPLGGIQNTSTPTPTSTQTPASTPTQTPAPTDAPPTVTPPVVNPPVPNPSTGSSGLNFFNNFGSVNNPTQSNRGGGLGNNNNGGQVSGNQNGNNNYA